MITISWEITQTGFIQSLSGKQQRWTDLQNSIPQLGSGSGSVSRSGATRNPWIWFQTSPTSLILLDPLQPPSPSPTPLSFMAPIFNSLLSFPLQTASPIHLISSFFYDSTFRSVSDPSGKINGSFHEILDSFYFFWLE